MEGNWISDASCGSAIVIVHTCKMQIQTLNPIYLWPWPLTQIPSTLMNYWGIIPVFQINSSIRLFVILQGQTGSSEIPTRTVAGMIGMRKLTKPQPIWIACILPGDICSRYPMGGPCSWVRRGRCVSTENRKLIRTAKWNCGFVWCPRSVLGGGVSWRRGVAWQRTTQRAAADWRLRTHIPRALHQRDVIAAERRRCHSNQGRCVWIRRRGSCFRTVHPAVVPASYGRRRPGLWMDQNLLHLHWSGRYYMHRKLN